MDGQSTSQSYFTDQQRPLGKTESAIGIPQVNNVIPTKDAHSSEYLRNG